jgi:UDP-N-acetyl-D-glucosamine dehydrogenase
VGNRVLVVGQGYVGLPLAVRAAMVGFEVAGVERDPDRYRRLCRGESYIEDLPSPVLREVIAAHRYWTARTVAEAGRFDIGIIAVPTPLTGGEPDLQHVRSASSALASCLQAGATVVLESTSYPGTTEEVVGPILEQGSGLRAGTDFRLGFSPERIDPGNRFWHFRDIPKLVSGIDDESLDAVSDFYAQLVGKIVPVARIREAELAKLIENTFRQVNIALVNELAMLAHGLGVDIWTALDAAATKPFGYLPFRPGPGVGGHCLPTDPTYLSWYASRVLQCPSRFVELSNEVNNAMPGYVTDRLVAGLASFEPAGAASPVLVVGAAYKPGTGDTRNAPATAICSELHRRGFPVVVADPYVSVDQLPPGTQKVELTQTAVAQARGALLLVAHPDLDLAPLTDARYVLDCCHRVSGPTVEYL